MPKRADADPNDLTLGDLRPLANPPLAFPEADWAWFAQRCQALGVAQVLALRPRIEALYGHLVGVNRWLNLTKLTTPRDYLKQHILDSVVAVSDARLRHLAEGAPCADLGSGGGYPGLPLAMCMPRVPWVLIDARKKKCEFLAAAAPLTGNAGVRARHLRGNETPTAAKDLHRHCQLVTCRAMADTVECMREAAPLLRRHGHLVVWKGPAFAGEERANVIAACSAYHWRLVSEREIELEPGDPHRVLVVLELER